ncbi:Protein-tyrosine-phosphatase [Pseudomonas sp. IT-P253]
MHNETLRLILGTLQIQKLRFVRKTHVWWVVDGLKGSYSMVY